MSQSGSSALIAELRGLRAMRDAVEAVVAFLDESAELHAGQGQVTSHYPIAQRLRRALGTSRVSAAK